MKLEAKKKKKKNTTCKNKAKSRNVEITDVKMRKIVYLFFKEMKSCSYSGCFSVTAAKETQHNDWKLFPTTNSEQSSTRLLVYGVLLSQKGIVLLFLYTM